jgi:hypothetical protein
MIFKTWDGYVLLNEQDIPICKGTNPTLLKIFDKQRKKDKKQTEQEVERIIAST